MAFTRETLKQIGVTDDEQIKKILDSHHAELGPVKDKADQYEAEKERADQLKADFDEQAKSIDALKASAGDKEALEKQIDELKNAATAKDAEHQKALDDMKTKLDGAEFDKLLDSAIAKAGGRRAAPIRAELDIEALRSSKDRSTDIEAAIKKLREAEDTAYLFGGEDPKPTGAHIDSSGRAGGGTGGATAAEAAARAVMGLGNASTGKEK